MSDYEIAYLALVLAGFILFSAVLAYATTIAGER